MTAYEQGFLTKCAEYGVDPMGLVKWAQGFMEPVRPVAPAQPQPANTGVYQPNDAERSAYRQWAKAVPGRGKALARLFTGADGKVDRMAFSKFLRENPGFLNGSDADRSRILNAHMKSMDPQARQAFMQSPEAQALRASRQIAQAEQRARVDKAMGEAQGRQSRMGDDTVRGMGGIATYHDPRTGQIVTRTGRGMAAERAALAQQQPQKTYRIAFPGQQAQPHRYAIDNSMRTFRRG